MKALVIGGIAAAAVGAALLLRKPEEEAQWGSFGAGGAGGGDGASWGDWMPYAASGAASAPGPVAALSPDFERQALAIAREDAASARQARNRDNAIQAAGFTAWAVPAAVGGGLALAKALSTPRVQYGLRTSPALSRTVSATRFAGAVGAGLVVGEAGVVALEKSGALDVVANVGRAAPVSPGVREAIIASIPGAAYVGAVATGLAGRGTVSGNVQEVNRAVGRTVNRAGQVVVRGGQQLATGGRVLLGRLGVR